MRCSTAARDGRRCYFMGLSTVSPPAMVLLCSTTRSPNWGWAATVCLVTGSPLTRSRRWSSSARPRCALLRKLHECWHTACARPTQVACAYTCCCCLRARALALVAVVCVLTLARTRAGQAPPPLPGWLQPGDAHAAVPLVRANQAPPPPPPPPAAPAAPATPVVRVAPSARSAAAARASPASPESPANSDGSPVFNAPGDARPQLVTIAPSLLAATAARRSAPVTSQRSPFQQQPPPRPAVGVPAQAGSGVAVAVPIALLPWPTGNVVRARTLLVVHARCLLCTGLHVCAHAACCARTLLVVHARCLLCTGLHVCAPHRQLPWPATRGSTG